MRISDWSSDVCSSDLAGVRRDGGRLPAAHPDHLRPLDRLRGVELLSVLLQLRRRSADRMNVAVHHAGGHIEGFEVPIHGSLGAPLLLGGASRGLAIVNGTLAAAIGLGLQQWIAGIVVWARSEEHTSELQSLMRTSYADFCSKKKTHTIYHKTI